jgi:hypothetical protein
MGGARRRSSLKSMTTQLGAAQHPFSRSVPLMLLRFPVIAAAADAADAAAIAVDIITYITSVTAVKADALTQPSRWLAP